MMVNMKQMVSCARVHFHQPILRTCTFTFSHFLEFANTIPDNRMLDQSKLKQKNLNVAKRMIFLFETLQSFEKKGKK